MKLKISSYKETSESQKINEVGYLLHRISLAKGGEKLVILIEGTKDILHLIISDEFKCSGGKESLLVSKELKITDGEYSLLKIEGPKFYLLEELKTEQVIENKKYTSKELLEMYHFEYIHDILEDINKIILIMEKREDCISSGVEVYEHLNSIFSSISKKFNNIGCFEQTSKQIHSFISLFSDCPNVEMEARRKIANNIDLFLSDFKDILLIMEEEFFHGKKEFDYSDFSEGENHIDKIIKKYEKLIDGFLVQLASNINLIMNPEDEPEEGDLELF